MKLLLLFLVRAHESAGGKKKAGKESGLLQAKKKKEDVFQDVFSSFSHWKCDKTNSNRTACMLITEKSLSVLLWTKERLGIIVGCGETKKCLKGDLLCFYALSPCH